MTNTTDLDSLHIALGEAERYAKELESMFPPGWPSNPKFKIGDRVRKSKGSSWQGPIVGFYSTPLTPEGYNVMSEREVNSVQIYPASALELVSA